MDRWPEGTIDRSSKYDVLPLVLTCQLTALSILQSLAAVPTWSKVEKGMEEYCFKRVYISE